MTPLRVVGVMGSSRERHVTRSRRVGVWIARAGYHLLTGGGPGVMAAVTEAFVSVTPRTGRAIGVLPADVLRIDGIPPAGYPNPWVEIAIRTHLDKLGPQGDDEASRNHLNVLSSDVIIILPGGAGTVSEARLAVHYGRPCIAHLDDRDDMPGLPDSVPVEPRFEWVQQFVREA